MSLDPARHRFDDPLLPQLMQLIKSSFSYMDGRIDPPSSILRACIEDLALQCTSGEVWSMGTPPVACVCFELLPNSLSLGRLAVAPNQRGQGLGRRLVSLAEKRARELGLTSVQLKVRVELIENRRLYEHLGFLVSEECSHAGFDRPTYWLMTKQLSRSN